MKNYLSLAFLASLSFIAITGCSTPTIEPAFVHKTSENLKLDGNLTEKSWVNATTHNLNFLSNWNKMPYKTKDVMKNQYFEGGKAKFLLGKEYLYIGIDFQDLDILCLSNAPQAHHYLNGDLVEIFIKPKNAQHYWELFFNPLKGRTSFVYSGTATRGPSCFSMKNFINDYKGEAKVYGTINKSTDKDTNWTAEIAIPLKVLAEKGVSFDEKNPWTILIARYNYGNHLRAIQFSTFPKLPQINYHLVEYYAPVKIVK
jgi:hypothetical protein